MKLLKTKTTVMPYEVAIHLRDGQILEVLEPGSYYDWSWRSQFVKFDTRVQSLVLATQEVLTQDNVSIKVTAVVQYALVDAEKFYLAAPNSNELLYQSLQIVLRDSIAKLPLQEVMKNRSLVGFEMKQCLSKRAEELGLTVSAVDVRDVIYPGELKTAIHETFISEQLAESKLIAARGEVAATRALANVSQQYLKNPELMKLRYIEVLSKAAEGTGNTFVLKNEDLNID